MDHSACIVNFQKEEAVRAGRCALAPVFFPKSVALKAKTGFVTGTASVVRNAGMTLVEVLVAISILAIITVLGWRSLDGILRARIAISSEMEAMNRVQLFFAQIQHDCALIQSPATGEPRVVVNGNTLSFIRTVFNENRPTQRQVVSYRLRDRILSRSESLPTRDVDELMTAWRAANANKELAHSVPIVTSAKSLQIRLWFNGNAGWMDSENVPPGPMINDITGLQLTLNFGDNNQGGVKSFLVGSQ